jgi:multiple sugar transport system permease protein
MTMQMFPFIAMLVPLFLLVRQLGLRDTWWSLILVDSAFIAPYAVWIMRNFFAAIPRDLDDAAAIDGAGRMRTLVSVVLPISAPGIAAIAIYAFLAAWNDFLAGFILTSTPNAQPLTVLMAQFSSHNMADIGLQITGGLLAALPPVVLVLVFQRYLVRGLTAGAVKG